MLLKRNPLATLRRITQPNRKILHQPPGTLIASKEAHPTSMEVFVYNKDEIQEHSMTEPEMLRPLLQQEDVCWIHVTGHQSTDVLQQLGQMFELHPLALEDVLSIPQRSKREDYGSHIYTVFHVFHIEKEQTKIEQVSMFLCGNAVISIQEYPGDCFDHIRTRLRSNRGQIRKMKHDYLFYTLLDAVVDHYFPLMEHYGDLLDDMEQGLFDEDTRDAQVLPGILSTRRALWNIRRVLWPLRDMVNTLSREEHDLIADEVRVYFRDCHDHTLRLIDLLENYREMNSHLKDVSLNLASHKLNEVMKVLTIISTIFIPLSFLVGLYGMNFDQASAYNMPELKHPMGYPILLSVMALITVTLLSYFFRKGWLTSK